MLLRLTAVAAAILLILLVMKPRPGGEEGDANTPFPAKLFADARAGDWASYVVAATENGRRAEPEVFAIRVTSVEGDRVTTRFETRRGSGPLHEGATRVFSMSRPPTVAELLAAPGARIAIENVQLAPERRSFETRSFRCTRVTFDRRGLVPEEGSAHVVAWVSPEIPGGIFSVLAIGADAHESSTVLVWELAGFGRGPRPTLGRTLDEIPSLAPDGPFIDAR